MAASPTRPQAYYNIGLASEELGHDDEALEYYRAARLAEPSYLSALEGLFRISVQQNDYAGAIDALNGWIEVTPYDAGLHRIIGHCYRKEGQNDMALQHLKKATELDPDGDIGREARRDILDL